MPSMRCLVVAVLAFLGSVWVLVLPHLLGLTGVWLWLFAACAAVPVALMAGLCAWVPQMPDAWAASHEARGPVPWQRVTPPG